MPKFISIILVVVLFCIAASAQSKSDDDISKQIRNLNTQKYLSVSYDGNTSKVMGVADNFADKDVSRVGVQAMNFALGFFFFGDRLQSAPDPILLSFWVLAKKPRFADDYKVVINFENETVSLGEVRYAVRPRENIEYLNCKITREELARIVREANVSVTIGRGHFKFSPDQIKVFSDILSVSDPAIFD